MRLIVNADDYGMTTEVSRGILHGMSSGFITDTSALVNSPDFQESAQLALEAGVISMGVHLNITLFKPLLDHARVSSIVDDQGSFYRKPALIPGSYDVQQVYDELRQQIEVFKSTGLQLNHLDTHHGFSVLDEQMLDMIIDLALEYQVPMRRDDFLAKEERLKGRIQERGVKSTDALCGDPANLFVPPALVQATLEKYKDTELTVEIAGHPGYADDKLARLSSLVAEREQDLQLFTDRDVMNTIEKYGAELISYSDL